jgi:hypothetical protein
LFYYPCSLGTPASVQGKTLSFQVFLDGPPLFDGTKAAAASVLSANGQTMNVPLSVGAWIPVTMPLTDATNATAGGFSFQLVMIPTGPPPANACMQWQGTVYFDAFSVK